MSYSRDNKDRIIAKADRLVRKNMLDTKNTLRGTLNEGLPHESVPQTPRHVALYLMSDNFK